MRVLMVTHTYPKYPDDVVAPFVADLVEALVHRGDTVNVVLPFHPELRQLERPGLRFLPYRYPFDTTRPWGFGETLRNGTRLRPSSALALPAVALGVSRHVDRILRQGDYDVLHAQWIVPNGALTSGAARSARVPLIVTLQGTDISIAEQSRLARFAAEKAFRSASAVVAISGHLRERALAVGAPEERTLVIRNGIWPDRFTPGASVSGIRERFGVEPAAFLVLAIGRLIEAKGFADLIKAAGCIDDVHLLVVGDGPLRGELEEAASRDGVRVTFAGNVERGAVPHVFAAADVVVVPSVAVPGGQTDGGPVTVLEALAAGRPLIATKLGFAADVVEDGTNGLLVEQRDPPAITERLAQLKRDPALRVRLGVAARRTAVETLGWKEVAEAYHECYEQAIELRR